MGKKNFENDSGLKFPISFRLKLHRDLQNRPVREIHGIDKVGFPYFDRCHRLIIIVCFLIKFSAGNLILPYNVVLLKQNVITYIQLLVTLGNLFFGSLK